MGIFGFLERTAGDSKLGPDWQNLTKTGYGGLDQGNALTTEGLNDMRSQYGTYQDRLKDPLGDVGRGIFTRARGALSDDAVRQQRSGQARIFQLARQTGGTLSPEAQGELSTQNQRNINESLFGAEGNLATSEATMTLNETSKLFDRMDSIAKTITGVGQDEKTRGLQAIIASLTGRTSRMKAIAADILGPWGHG